MSEERIPILRECPNKMCYCTGACKEVIGWTENNMNININKWRDIVDNKSKNKGSRFEKLPEEYKVCRSPDHQPPTHLYISPDEIFIHVCTGCGEETRLRGSSVSY